MKILLNLLITSFIVAIIAFAFGAYNMSATDKHWGITEKFIESMRENSIEIRSRDLTVPSLEEADMLSAGAEHYHAMCTICHLAPGMKPTELSVGLYPSAPIFHEREPISDPAEKLAHAKAYFWVIKNGLKMTAMPAWGLSHDDQEIWGMTAFIFKLSKMAPEQYQELIHAAEHDDHGHSHEHSH
ncbi:cytochrome c [Nitrosomonas sp. JL21]|uniref:c-type cytochrome n=1 Tax=Nitrosomonas sp. JL21 TaxID=153949 RepID=UPI00136F3265|nr:cytochrome c [Nitrosomonas sp. JL21]MBL8496731.1 cytochrome c [Nitrosomonas sp.]MXS76531.1 cytochrome c [Nitrosomonas sp. JL21]